MSNVNTANRAELEVEILKNDLEGLFGGLKAIIAMDTETIREKLINWVVEGGETL